MRETSKSSCVQNRCRYEHSQDIKFDSSYAKAVPSRLSALVELPATAGIVPQRGLTRLGYFFTYWIAGQCKPAGLDGDVHYALVACRTRKTTQRGKKGKEALGVTRLCWLNSGTAQLRAEEVVGRWGADRRWTQSPEKLCRMALQARPQATSTGTAETCENHTDTSVYAELVELNCYGSSSVWGSRALPSVVLVCPSWKNMNKEYSAYINSPEWRSKRQQRIAIDGNKCQSCGTTEALEVHHLTYRRVFREEMSDLITLCYNHHMAAEEFVKSGLLPRHGDVEWLARLTLYLINPSGNLCRTVLPPPVNRLSTRNQVQEELFTQPWFIEAMKLPRKPFKKHCRKQFRGSSIRCRLMANAMVLYDRHSYKYKINS